MNLTIDGPSTGRSSICEPILRALPEWFGLEQANIQYLQDIESLPTFIASVDGCAAGFLTLKQHSEFSAEIHVLGVLPELHRVGVGRALVNTAESYLAELGVEYLQVKTLSGSHPDPHYAKTRALGFRPLEEFKTLWGENNPCLLMVKNIDIGIVTIEQRGAA